MFEGAAGGKRGATGAVAWKWCEGAGCACASGAVPRLRAGQTGVYVVAVEATEGRR